MLEMNKRNRIREGNNLSRSKCFGVGIHGLDIERNSDIAYNLL